MAQHFLLSRQAKTLTLAEVFRMSDAEAEAMMMKIRWTETDGQPVCSHCGSLTVYLCRRPSGAARWRCKDCGKDFSITSGTLFASHKLPLRGYLAAIAIFCNEVKGKNALALSRDIGLSYKSAFVLAHKLRETMGEELKGRMIGDDRPEASVDGAYFGGHIRPANHKENRRDRRLAQNQTGKRRVVVIARERKGRTLTTVTKSEADGVAFVKAVVSNGSVVHADEATYWDALHAKFETYRINHTEAYSKDGACTNQAESFLARLRRMVDGQHHHVSPQYLHQYAAHAAWAEDHRREDNGALCQRALALALEGPSSSTWKGYWQRAAMR